MSESRLARLLVLGAAVLWSTSGAAIKSTSLGVWPIAGGRALFAAAAIAVLLPASRRRLPPGGLLVALAYALTAALFVRANTLTTSANAIFLQDVAPLWVILLGPWVAGERPTRLDLLLAPVYIAGAALVFLDGLGPGRAAGNAVAIAAGVAFALLILGLRRLRDEGAAAAVLWGNLATVVLCAPGALADLEPLRAAGARDLAIVAYLGVFQLGLAYALFVRALRSVPAVEASLLALFEPVLNPVWALALAGEAPGPWAIAGGTAILLATAGRVIAAPGREAA